MSCLLISHLIFFLSLIGCLNTIDKYDWLAKVSTLTGWLKNDAITTQADVSKAQNSAITAPKWCNLGCNSTIF